MFMASELTSAGSKGIPSLILTLRGLRVMLDSDLARLFGVTTGRLNQALKRNRARFPDDFAFQIERKELASLKSHSVISSSYGGRRTLPWVFTEHGVVMLASVLNSKVAVEASVRVVRAFVHLREQLLANRALARKFDELEKRVDAHDESLAALFDAIRQLLAPPTEPGKEIGFHIREQAAPYRVRVHRRK